MASRVNVKFVVILSVVLVLIAVGAGALAVTVVFKSAEDLIARGDEKLAEGDITGAELAYSKAVNKDPYNDDYLLKWRSAIHEWVPETDQEFGTEFRSTYMSLHNQLALSDQMAHPEYQEEYLRLRWESSNWSGFDRRIYDAMVDDLNRYIAVHEIARPNDPSWLPLREFRGRALARIAAANFELTPEQKATAETDLQAVLQAQPDNLDAMESLVALKEREAARAAERDRITAANRLRDEARAILEEFAAANPPETVAGAQAEMLRVQNSMSDERQAAVAELGAGALPRLNEIASRYHERTREIGETLISMPPSAVPTSAARRLIALESQTTTGGGLAVSLGLVEHLLRETPDDPELLLLQADLLNSAERFDESFATLEHLASQPRRAIGMSGMRLIQSQVQGSFDRAQNAIRAFAATEDEAEKSTWLARAEAARADLSRQISDSSPQVRLLDARLAYAKEEFFKAQQLVGEFNSLTNNSVIDGLWLSADISSRLNQPGNTRIALEQILRINPRLAAARVALANVELQLNRPEAALEQFNLALQQNPQNPAILERIAEIEKILGRRAAEDPIEEIILQARRMASGTESEIADMAGAIATLRATIDSGATDLRLYQELARYQLMSGALESAATTVAQGLERFPGDERLVSYEDALAAGDSIEGRAAFVLKSDLTEIEKQFQLYALYENAGRREEATAALEAARSLDPNSNLLLELEFSRAFQDKNIEAARRLAERAKVLDVDRVGGLTYRARLLILQGNRDDAIAALNEAVQRDPNNASSWRILGNLQMQSERSGDAFASFQRALQIRPRDLATAIDYCTALMSLDRDAEALEVARRAEVHHRTNPRFMDLLLDLESQAGDKTRALQRREGIFAVRPDDVGNRNALASLYIDLGRWDQARGLIDSTRAEFGPSGSLVFLDARWWAERNDIERARNVFARDIAETHPSERMDRYIALGQFMYTRGFFEMAVRAFRQAGMYQPEGSHRADLLLGDLLLMRSRESEALPVYTRIIESGGDSDGSVTKRAAEAAIRLSRFTEAERLLASIEDSAADATVVLLRADALTQRGDTSGATKMLDSAVATWPNDVRVWIKRAEVLALNDALLPDALADLDQAIKIQPISQAYAQRASVLARLGREDEALTALRDAVRLNPALEDLRVRLISEALRRDRPTVAMDMANEWFARSPRDIGLRARVAEIFVRGGRVDEATRVLRDALALEQQPQVVLRLADLLVGSNPPKYAEAERVFNDARDMVNTNSALLMARARVYASTNRVDAAFNDCNQSFRLLNREPASMMFWFSTLRNVFQDPATLLSYIQSLSTQQGAQGWAALFRARALMDSPATKSQGVAELRALETATRDPMVKYATLRALAGEQYASGQHENAVQIWKQALALQPNDWQLENNIAYALAADLDRPEEALPFAELAARHATENAETLDTLGTVLLKLGRASEAVGPLEAAVRASAGTAQNVQYLVRLAQARIETGDTQGARDLVSQVQGLLDRGLLLDDQYQTILDDVSRRLGEG